MKVVYVIAIALFLAGMLVGLVWMWSAQRQGRTPAGSAGTPALAASEPRSSDHLTGNHKLIFDQLDMLTRRGEDEMAFVIFTNEATSKYVQFSGPHITLDLPISHLDAESQQRARTLFLAYPRSLEYDEGWGPNIQLQLDDDVELAATIAMQVFREVHELPDDFEIRVTTDKD